MIFWSEYQTKKDLIYKIKENYLNEDDLKKTISDLDEV